MTQASFAQAINYSAKSTISLWERGLRPVTPRAYPALDRIEKCG
jgi:transcriptional regulator with XRE-family HTH domain